METRMLVHDQSLSLTGFINLSNQLHISDHHFPHRQYSFIQQVSSTEFLPCVRRYNQPWCIKKNDPQVYSPCPWFSFNSLWPFHSFIYPTNAIYWILTNFSTLCQVFIWHIEMIENSHHHDTVALLSLWNYEGNVYNWDGKS